MFIFKLLAIIENSDTPIIQNSPALLNISAGIFRVIKYSVNCVGNISGAKQLDKTWKPAVAGILNIVSGAVGLIAVSGLIIAIIITGGFYLPGTEEIPEFVPFLLIGLAVPLAILSILSLLGGIYAVQRKIWGLALAGSIAAVFASIPLLGGLPVGITAIILTALSKNEFD